MSEPPLDLLVKAIPGIRYLIQFMMNRTPPSIDSTKDCFPFCLVWSPLPVITWFLPFIGHTGIADSNGVIHDFAGPYTISIGKFSFGAPTRYIQLDPAKCCYLDWDSGIRDGDEIYRGRMHNLFCDNCHSHVGKCLNVMGYDKRSTFGMFKICFWFFFFGRFVSVKSFLKTYTPFVIFVLIILLSTGVIL